MIKLPKSYDLTLLVKPSALKEEVTVIPLEKPLIITGIGDGEEQAEYVTFLRLGEKVKHMFFVVSDNFNIQR